MKRIFITGASGFIGRNLLDLLEKENCEVYSLSRSALVHPVIYKNYQADLFDTCAMSRALSDSRADTLIHLAWYANPMDYKENPIQLKWIDSSFELIKKFVELGGQTVFVAGTCFEYGLGDYLLKEDYSAEAGQTLYGISKCSLKNLMMHYVAKNHPEVKFIWGRMFYPFGKYESAERVLPYVINSLLAGREALCSIGNPVRDYIYAEDLADSIIRLSKSGFSGLVNLGRGEGVPLSFLFESIGAILGKPELIKLGAIPGGEQADRIVADSSKLKQAGWSAPTALLDGLEKTINWWKTKSNKI